MFDVNAYNDVNTATKASEITELDELHNLMCEVDAESGSAVNAKMVNNVEAVDGSDVFYDQDGNTYKTREAAKNVIVWDTVLTEADYNWGASISQ